MDKQNEKAPKNEEIMELTPDQMDKVSGGRFIDPDNSPFCVLPKVSDYDDPLELPDYIQVIIESSV